MNSRYLTSFKSLPFFAPVEVRDGIGAVCGFLYEVVQKLPIVDQDYDYKSYSLPFHDMNCIRDHFEKDIATVFFTRDVISRLSKLLSENENSKIAKLVSFLVQLQVCELHTFVRLFCYQGGLGSVFLAYQRLLVLLKDSTGSKCRDPALVVPLRTIITFLTKICLKTADTTMQHCKFIEFAIIDEFWNKLHECCQGNFIGLMFEVFKPSVKDSALRRLTLKLIEFLCLHPITIEVLLNTKIDFYAIMKSGDDSVHEKYPEYGIDFIMSIVTSAGVWK